MGILFYILWLAAGLAGFAIGVFSAKLLDLDDNSSMMKEAYLETLVVFHNWKKFKWFIIPSVLGGFATLAFALVGLMFGMMMVATAAFNKIRKSIKE